MSDALKAREAHEKMKRAMRLWREHGGSQHGPHVETLSMPLDNFAGFVAALSALDQPSGMRMSVKPNGDEINRMADAIDAARYAHPQHPRERNRPFAEADKGDREYAFRLARAAFAALDLSAIGAEGWRTMDSAPKDGTRVLLVREGADPVIAYWRDSKGGQWFADSLPGFWYEGMTHWQPLLSFHPAGRLALEDKP